MPHEWCQYHLVRNGDSGAIAQGPQSIARLTQGLNGWSFYGQYMKLQRVCVCDVLCSGPQSVTYIGFRKCVIAVKSNRPYRRLWEKVQEQSTQYKGQMYDQLMYDVMAQAYSENIS